MLSDGTYLVTPPDVAGLVAAAQVRLARLFSWMDDIERYGGGPGMLAQSWQRASDLAACVLAAEEACCQAAGRLARCGEAQAMLAVARRADPADPAWLPLVREARAAFRRRELAGRGELDALWRCLPAGTRLALSREHGAGLAARIPPRIIGSVR